MTKIMIIDDDYNIVNLLAMYLQRHGYQTIGLVDPTQAAEIAEEEQPDLVILDLKMPFMDGYATSRALRRVPELRATPIILLTAQGIEQYNAKVEPGNWSHIERKPVNFLSLLTTIESFLEAA